FILPVATAFCISVYGFFEALSIRTEHVTIATTKLPPAMPRLRIVQLSDVHLGLIVREERLARILAAVRAAEPDLLVITGDLLDGQPDGYAPLARMIGAIKSKLGKFAITGNHEYYVGLGEMEAFCREAGLTLLRGEETSAGGVVNIAGVDDPAGERAGLTHRVSESALLQGLPTDGYTLLLKHRPVVAAEARGLFDLQLSGHVHKGQIFPFNIVTHFFYPVKMGLSAAGSGSSLYVNRGAGTWGAPIRFLAPPEVTVIDLVRGV
ncbi:MAG TPA: metallophosphoesterase, partial [Geobacteraceae bacterium]